jgi:hypothetical protein
MKHIKEHSFIKRISNKCLVKIFVDEYATIWRLSAKKIGHEMPCAIHWRYSKKHFPKIHLVIEQFLNEI